MKICSTIITAFVTAFIFGCGAAQPTVSPTETLKIFIEASRKKDVEAVKKTLSKASLEMTEKSAREHNTTLDELLKKDDVQIPEQLPEIRNEKIEGETATVEIKDSAKGYETLPFVKEDGSWKIAFDTYEESIKRKMQEEEIPGKK